MSRWRPPAPASTALITAAGHKALRSELDELWQERRPEVVSALSAAAAEGDRSENAEYIYRRKQLGEIDRRIRYLRKRLDVLKVVDGLPADRESIFFGAWVELEHEDGSCRWVRIVGPDEIDPGRDWISIDSIIARALLKRRAGDELEVELPAGRSSLAVLNVSYEDPQSG